MNINKEEYTKHIKDNEKKIEIRKIIDKIEIVLNKHIIQTTDFLDPFEVELAVSVLNRFEEIEYSLEGGYQDAERKIIIIYPFYIFKEDIEIPVSSLKITGDLKEIEHKDYLGSILSLGLKRSKIGDILVYEDEGVLIVKQEISDFVLYNLEKIRNKNIEIFIHNQAEIEPPLEEYKEINKFLVSLRIDSIISAAYNLSRKESILIIDSGKVKINFETIDRASKEVKEGDLISVKGFGRFILHKIKGTSKSGRFICVIRIIL
nr:YlmH/Sll1252 family protein [Tissierella sp.]